MRRPIIAGNWKMNMTPSESAAFIEALSPLIAEAGDAEIVVAPPFPALYAVALLTKGGAVSRPIRLAAQNLHWEEKGAYTGEVSAEMLVDIGCDYAIVAHSERRQYFGETNEIAALKIKAALRCGIAPIYCVGETLEQREAGQVEAVLKAQLRGGLDGMTAEQARSATVAYEPVWAIGTGKTASEAQAQEAHALIRAELAEMFDDKTAQTVRIQYGGSMKPMNAAGLLAQPDIDGGLIGGASLDADSFARIVMAANRLG